MSEVKHRCCAKYGEWFRHTCGKSAKFERNGCWYCGTHDPVAVKVRDDKRMAAWKAKWDAETEANESKAAKRKETERRAACFDELVEALQAYQSAGVGNSTDFVLQVNAEGKARLALMRAQGAQP